MSGYAVTAQFYDAMADHQHADVDEQIAAALKDLDTRGGPVVDVGAGSARVIATDRQLWRMRYRSLLDEVEIGQQCAEFVCHVVSADQVAAEAARHGFVAEVRSALVLLTLRPL